MVYVSPGDMPNLDLLIYIRRIWSWPMPYGGGRCGRCGAPKTMLFNDHLLPNTGLLTRSARKLNTVSSVIPRVDERGLLNCGGNIQDLWSVKIGVWKGYQLGKLIQPREVTPKKAKRVKLPKVAAVVIINSGNNDCKSDQSPQIMSSSDITKHFFQKEIFMVFLKGFFIVQNEKALVWISHTHKALNH